MLSKFYQLEKYLSLILFTFNVVSDIPYSVMVASSGGFAKHYRSFLGTYKLTSKTYYGQPVYKHVSRNLYLYRNALSDWVIDWQMTPSQSSVWADADKDIPTRSGWIFRVNGRATTDSTMRVWASKNSY